jgi:hypothetical protein
MKKLLPVLAISLLNVAFASDKYPGTRFCDMDTTFQDESAQKQAYQLISPESADRENANLIQIPGEFLQAESLKSIAQLCQGTTPLKVIKASAIAYDPSFEAGSSIDKVTAYRNALKHRYSEFAQHYFTVSSRSPRTIECGNSLVNLPWQLAAKNVAYNSGGFFGITLDNPEDLEVSEAAQKFKQMKGDLELDSNGNIDLPQMVIAKIKGKWASIFIPPSLFKKLYYDDQNQIWARKPPFSAHVLHAGAYSTADSVKLKYFEGADEKYMRVTPLKSVCIGDACILRQNYLFSDLPDTFQKDTLKIQDPLGRDSKTHRWTIEAANRDANALWDAYMTRYTSVKEVQVPEEKLTKYEVELDLEPFCRYALPKKDMIAR